MEREQYYIDLLLPTYNINPTAGSRLGSIHSAKTIVKMRGENNHMFGRAHTIETKASISNTLSGRSLSAETRALMSLAQKGKIISVNT